MANSKLKNDLIHFEELEEGILSITLNRPEKRNALNQPLLQELIETLHFSHQKMGARVILVRGAGNSFCSGLDLEETKTQAAIEASANLIAKALTTLHESPLVTIALVQGSAIAGGAGLFCSCDLAIAARGAMIGFPETRRGLVAALISAPLKRQLRDRSLRELLLLGELIDATRALEIGLVNAVTCEDNLLEDGLRMAKLVLKGAPGATAMTKKLLDELEPNDFSSDLAIAMKYHQMARQSPECVEGALAFFEKRPPSWSRFATPTNLKH